MTGKEYLQAVGALLAKGYTLSEAKEIMDEIEEKMKEEERP